MNVQDKDGEPHRIAIGLEYDGSAFHGWQSQTGGETVQDVLEAALAAIAGHAVRAHCAGRTDAGVHATGQVAHFDSLKVRPLSAWVRGVNAHLPKQVAILWAHPVSSEFHARFSARTRRYRYELLNRPTRPGLLDAHVGWYHRPLDVGAMARASRVLIGRHDFSAFRCAQCQAKSPIKTLHRLDIHQVGERISFHLEADGFLHHMVRNIVGALVYVGKGTHPPAWVGEVLAGRDRARAAPTFEACGLYFAGVDYDPVWQLKVERSGIHSDGAGDTALVLP